MVVRLNERWNNSAERYNEADASAAAIARGNNNYVPPFNHFWRLEARKVAHQHGSGLRVERDGHGVIKSLYSEFLPQYDTTNESG